MRRGSHFPEQVEQKNLVLRESKTWKKLHENIDGRRKNAEGEFPVEIRYVKTSKIALFVVLLGGVQ